MVGTSAPQMGLQKLLLEPKRLLDDANSINSELEHLVIENYTIFIENITCNSDLQSEESFFLDCSSELSRVVTDISNECRDFRSTVSVHVNNYKRNRKILQHYLRLLDLLEVPALADSCARNGFLDDVIELGNFVNGLERRQFIAADVEGGTSRVGSHSTIEKIADAVHTTLSTLRKNLLFQLTESISLPKQMQLVSVLRKLDGLSIDRQIAAQKLDDHRSISNHESTRSKLGVFNNRKLQMDFLEARSLWMEKAFETAADSRVAPSRGLLVGAYSSTIERLEVRRSALFAIVTQFRALFIQDDYAENSQIDIRGDEDAGYVLQCWINYQIDTLLQELRTVTQQIDDGAEMRSIIEQSIFLSSRLGSLGCDLTPSCMIMFEKAVLEKVSTLFQQSVSDFLVVLESEQYISKGTDQCQCIPLFSYVEQQTSIAPEDQQSSIPFPPRLLHFPPVALLTNFLLNAINFLRECPLSSIFDEIINEVFAALKKIVNFIGIRSAEISLRGAKHLSDRTGNKSRSVADNMYASSWQADASKTDLASPDFILLLKNVILFDFAPHLLACVSCIFGRLEISAILSAQGKVHSQLAQIPLVQSLLLLPSIVVGDLFSDDISTRLKELQKSELT